MILDAAFQAMLDNTTDMIFVKNVNLEYIAVSMPFVKRLGKENASQVIGKMDYELLSDKNLASRYVADDHRLLEEGIDQTNTIYPVPDENGQSGYGATSKYILKDKDGRKIGILGITRTSFL